MRIRKQNAIPTFQTQVCIAGGGPAGLMAGLLFARAGLDTVVLEKHSDFLRDFRGDTVHPSTLDVIDELGYLKEFLKRPHQEFTRLKAVVEGEVISIADFRNIPTRRKSIVLMPQWDFLNFLAGKAQALPNFKLLMETDCQDLLHGKGGAVEGVRCLGRRGAFRVYSELVIAADGRKSILRKKAHLHSKSIGAPMDVLWMRVRRKKGDPRETMGRIQRGRMVALLLRGDYWQVGYLVRKGGYEGILEGGIQAFRNDLISAVPFFRDRVEAIRSFDDIKFLEVKVDRLKRWWKPGLICIGDSAHAMSPIGGVGINLAIQDAVAAAKILSGPIKRGSLTDADLQCVQARREFPTQMTQSIQAFLQRKVIDRVLTSDQPLQLNWIVRLLQNYPWLQGIPARILGVGIRPEHI